MKRIISLKKMVATAGALFLAVGGTAQAQQPPTAGIPEINVVQPELIKSPAAQIVEKTAAAPPMVFGTATNDYETGLNVGIGFYFIKPYWASNPAFSHTTTTFAANSTTTSTQTQDFGYDLRLAPRIFFGYVGESGLGGRVSWWRFDQRVTASAVDRPIPPFPATQVSIFATGLGAGGLLVGQTDVYTLGNHLAVDVWDFDLTQHLISNDLWEVTGGAGIRYNYLSQNYDAFKVRTGLPAKTVNNQEFHSRNLFNGAGPDVLVQAKRALGSRGFALYGNARAGAMFGTGRQTSSFMSSTAGAGAPLFVAQTNTQTDHNAVLPFLESEVGIEWQGGSSNAMQPFIRIGIVGQSWFGAGNGSITSNTSNLGFFGGTLMAGFNY
jgi:hypothetical protein